MFVWDTFSVTYWQFATDAILLDWTWIEWLDLVEDLGNAGSKSSLEWIHLNRLKSVMNLDSFTFKAMSLLLSFLHILALVYCCEWL